uniref:growth/differentiation factor 9-like n=1 Tax=Doryrhamphus excisus TaxID=161450 RepID=UPI0025ADC019|nr:growth/differentiation factor 9-like [Doryrhamphus excisus]
MFISVVISCFRATMFLLLVSSGCPPPLPCSAGHTDALHSISELSQYTSGSIFSPLLKALSEHGGSRWNPTSRKKIKPEHKYIKYLTDVYKRTARDHRSLDGGAHYNVVRLIKPQEQCLAKSGKEMYKLDLSYSLDQVREKEQLVKATLLYSSDRADSVCYLSIKEQEHSNKCPLCAGIHRAVNFSAGAHDSGRGHWVEVDVTFFLQPLSKVPKQNVQLLIDVVCSEEQLAVDVGHKGSLEFTVDPPLLLYLHDDSKVSRQVVPSKTLSKQMLFKASQMVRAKRRRKRESSKSKRGDKSFDIHLPELLPSSEFSTSYCDLYDFRVRFSQLKLDHWIVFPPKYNPRYCRGICPRTIGFIYGSPVHTMVQNIIYEKLDSSVPRPSCIPSHYSPLSVMIFEEDGSYVYKEFEDMIATRCTCR